jgi:hypothetical protein
MPLLRVHANILCLSVLLLVPNALKEEAMQEKMEACVYYGGILFFLVLLLIAILTH